MRSVCCWLVAGVVVVGGLFLWWLFMTAHSPMEGVYVAGSKIPDKEALGLFGEWDNYPKDLGGKDWGEAGKVSLIAFPDEQAAWRDLRGFALRLVNRTDKPVVFGACDSRMFLVQEALDRDGNWRAIELPPVAYCGNSSHRVFLDKDQYWEFPAPRYGGSFKTQLRFRLEATEKRLAKIVQEDGEVRTLTVRVVPAGDESIYSNEFEGWINTSQFVP
jgi:hypothetical protein